ncbi:MAG: YdcF family protein [Anaerolineales bacterium]|nr:YdcF family protein [Anaerolineales bacterium]
MTVIVKSATNKKAKKKNRRRRGCFGFLAALLVLLTFPFAWRVMVKWAYQPQIFQVSDAPSKPVAIVLGAAVYGNGRLSAILRDRMETAIELYQSGVVDKIIVSGDNSDVHYNEPQAMLNYAISRGVPEQDIQPDYAGLRTYDTCYRARHIFQVEAAIVVTQEFHLPRALFTCKQLGIDAVGVGADLRPYRGARWYEVRETGATLVALWDVLRRQPATIMGDPIPLE